MAGTAVGVALSWPSILSAFQEGLSISTVGGPVAMCAVGTGARVAIAQVYLCFLQAEKMRRAFVKGLCEGLVDEDMVRKLVNRFLDTTLRVLVLETASPAFPAPKASVASAPSCLRGHYEAIVWYDPNIGSAENQKYLVMLREKHAALTAFDNVAEAARHVERNPLLSFTVITSGSEGQKLVGLIHDLPNVKVALVFCRDVQWHQGWAATFRKVGESRVYDRVEPLVRKLAEPADAAYQDRVSARVLTKEYGNAVLTYVRSLLTDDYQQMTISQCVECLAEFRRADHRHKTDYAEWLPAYKMEITAHFEEPRRHSKELLHLYTEETAHVYDTMNKRMTIKLRDRGLLMMCKLAEGFLNALHKLPRVEAE